MATCKFGADDQKLQGAARKAFMKKCMSDKDEPHGATGALAGFGETGGARTKRSVRATPQRLASAADAGAIRI
jgi:psiF repeat